MTAERLLGKCSLPLVRSGLTRAVALQRASTGSPTSQFSPSIIVAASDIQTRGLVRGIISRYNRARRAVKIIIIEAISDAAGASH